MDTKGRQIWQVGAGDTSRRFDSHCKEFDVMMVGPGDRGPYVPSKYQDCHSVRRFYEDARSGDIVLLRLGTGTIFAVGEIVDDQPLFIEQFGDVDGWDLQHVRRVRWFERTKKEFPSRTLGGQVRTFAKVGVEKVKRWITDLEIDQRQLHRPLKALPPEARSLSIEELGHRLFVEGLPSRYIDDLARTLGSIIRVAEWYYNPVKRPKNRPSEAETICYLTVPLLFSLGWSQQTAAIEWNKIDVALFNEMPPTDETLACVLEAKSLDSSVLAHIGQAANYARGERREGCHRLILTDGIRYALYRRRGDQFERHAYLNIRSMREQYPVLGFTGAVDAILGMAKGQM